jgi:hypothetical protein
MKFDNFLARVPSHYWGYLVLGGWAVVAAFLANGGPYGIEEGGAKALLLAWSIADQVATSAVTFSAPDLRAVLFLPMGYLWPGSVLAAKVFVVLASGAAAALMFIWSRHRFGDEAAMLATGLLLIAPLTFLQIDTLGAGGFVLLSFALGGLLDQLYRTNPHAFGGAYFAQLALCALSVSLHPAGLAYPLALLWGWRIEPLDRMQQKYFFVGIIFVTLFTLLARMGWHDLDWLQNPILGLAAGALGSAAAHDPGAATWVVGLLVGGVLATILLTQLRSLWSDLTGRCLLMGVVLGAFAADSTWSYLALAVILFVGFPRLLRPPSADAPSSFLRQRGIALVLIFILSLLFMRADKEQVLANRAGEMSAQDQLIRTLADEIASARAAVAGNRDEQKQLRQRVASQWPSRTMLACRCDTLPLPPAAKDPQAQLAMMRSITHLLLDPKQPSNLGLADNLAALGGDIETISLQPGGVMLRVKTASETAAPK